MHKNLRIAAGISVKGNKIRRAFLGAVGVRSDGIMVYSYNGCAENKKPEIHAEARLSKKLDVGATVYVARTRRDDGTIAMAKPCCHCENALRHRGVKKVFYTISESEWGCIEF